MNRNPFAVLAIGLIMVIMYMERVTPAPTRQPQLSPWLCFGALGLIVFLWVRMLFPNTKTKALVDRRPPLPAVVPTYPATRIVPDLPSEWRGVPYPEYKSAQVMSESDNPETRRQAAMEISQDYRWCPEYMSTLVQLAHDPDKRVRIAAIRAIGHWNRGGRATLIEALSDGHLGVRLEAIRALRNHVMDGDSLAAILRGPDRVLHAAAADSLGNMWGSEVVPALIEAVGNTYTTITRRKAARSLVKQRDVRGVGPLLNAIGDPNSNIRAAAARALRQLVEHLNYSDRGEASDSLRAGFNHPSPTVRLHAAFNLGMLGKPDGVAILTEALTKVEPVSYLTKDQLQEALNRVGR